MITEQMPGFIIRSKTGWARVDGKDIGWWVGYVERDDNTFFFATRITKLRNVRNTEFGQCRKSITKLILTELGAMDK